MQRENIVRLHFAVFLHVLNLEFEVLTLNFNSLAVRRLERARQEERGMETVVPLNVDEASDDLAVK